MVENSPFGGRFVTAITKYFVQGMQVKGESKAGISHHHLNARASGIHIQASNPTNCQSLWWPAHLFFFIRLPLQSGHGVSWLVVTTQKDQSSFPFNGSSIPLAPQIPNADSIIESESHFRKDRWVWVDNLLHWKWALSVNKQAHCEFLSIYIILSQSYQHHHSRQRKKQIKAETFFMDSKVSGGYLT